MAGKKYSINWENGKAVSFEIDGVLYSSLDEIPDPRDLHKMMAMMDAAAIDRHFASPLTIVRVATSSGGALLPSTSASFGTVANPLTASRIAHIVAPRMFSRSIRVTSAISPSPSSAC